MKIQPNSLLLFIGDSITDCGRKRPVGEGAFGQALGNGYVSLVNAALSAAYPDYATRVVNMGISGETSRDLESRWKSDVLDLQPDWLSVKIGANDVWQQISWPQGRENNLSVEAYADTLDDLIQQVLPSLQGLILMTPYFLEPDLQDPMRALMDQYGAVVGELAVKHKAVFVDTQAAFDTALQWIEPLRLAEDRVHVNLSGHMIIARAFLQAIGYDWERSQS
ncbi:MAG: SGNH/GDSL hydrolase family protein [Chloroflexi bacterium]|nr:SGNH/GDSL hydrolase family protein [Chloroflexota bacterium]